jgi:hypothetical protein
MDPHLPLRLHAAYRLIDQCAETWPCQHDPRAYRELRHIAEILKELQQTLAHAREVEKDRLDFQPRRR